MKYHIIGDSDAIDNFRVDENTGDILCEGDLDYENEQLYNVIVKAINEGTDLSSSTTIHVHITSDNEFKPQCSENEYRFHVSESAQLGTEVGRIIASDEDEGIDGKSLFYLIDTDLKSFDVDSITGVITVSKQVDKESSSIIEFDLLVKNPGSVSCDNSDICQVVVSVGDANDPPSFTQRDYSTSIAEDARLATPVLEVQATDQDTQTQSFSYEIQGSNDYFSLHERNGQITLKKLLDREERSKHSFVIMATDNGKPPQTGEDFIPCKITMVKLICHHYFIAYHAFIVIKCNFTTYGISILHC